ncbi:RNA polymerase sigma factor [Paraliomyxa miuraensis]|uniref:RNA polymerase sigma factor n=1 Tax=Paraliomyxa miuraensis TaxID=376150 RepID=UPI002255A23B|nr:sigma-70 family RNA polymerase sigma factor [Paraliomyxa miuraensis]MCX4240445.1 sigma-70 family RNA polymerase sigma factor [Paraliomyxa miuraensis]
MPPKTPFPELPRERVARALAGDRVAVAELYTTYDPAVRSAVVAAIRHRADLESELEDFISETWARFVADGCWRLRSYDPQRGTFGYYIRMRAFATARSLASKREHRMQTVALTDPRLVLDGDDGLENWVLSRDELERLWTALRERLGEIDLALFRSVFAEGRLVREVAGELQLTEAAAYRRCHRLRQKIESIASELLGPAVVPRVGPFVVVMLAGVMAQGMLRDSSSGSPPVTDPAPAAPPVART